MFESEERRIAERIKEYIKKKEPLSDTYIMLSDGRILLVKDYRSMVRRGKIKPHDAYVYIELDWPRNKSGFYYPFLDIHADLSDAYLSKLGFNAKYFSIAPATGLKYVATTVTIYDKDLVDKYLSIEVVNLDIAINNTNLPKIVAEVVGKKLVSGERELTEEEYRKILEMSRSQRLFAGYDFEEAWNMVNSYYDKGNKSLAKEVARIGIDYYRIFNPYRVCYNMKTWKEIDCWSIDLG